MLEGRTAHTAATLKAVRVLLDVVFFRHLEAALAIYAAARDGEERVTGAELHVSALQLTQV